MREVFAYILINQSGEGAPLTRVYATLMFSLYISSVKLMINRRVFIATFASGSGAYVPVGDIMIWSGSIASIPGGWALCDRTPGTPDLRDRFVKGTGIQGEVGTTGGATTHTHATHTPLTHSITDPKHSHAPPPTTATATTGLALSAHSGTAVANHSFTPTGTVGAIAATATAASPRGGSTANVAAQTHTHPAPSLTMNLVTLTHSVTQPSAHTITDPAHSHIISAATGTSSTDISIGDHSISPHDSPDSQPPWFKLCYIMKL